MSRFWTHRRESHLANGAKRLNIRRSLLLFHHPTLAGNVPIPIPVAQKGLNRSNKRQRTNLASNNTFI